MNSIWVTVNGFEDYMISPEGNILSKGTGFKKKAIVLKACKESTGYLSIQLYSGKKGKRFYIHRLVAQHFCENLEHKRVVNHKDGDRHNNNYKNLEWVTAKENINHGISVLGTIRVSGEDNPKAKLNRHQVDQIKTLISENVKTLEISKMFQVNVSTINRIKNGKLWNK